MKNYKRIFSQITDPEVPGSLFGKIMSAIYGEQRLIIVKRRLAVFSAVLLASAAFFVPAFQAINSVVYKSGFTSFISLIFSDFGTVVAYWQSFAMSVLETFPVFETSVVLLIISAFVISANFIINDIKTIYRSQHYKSHKLIIN